MNIAFALKLASIAMPAISTGIFGFPKDRAAGFIFSVIENYFVETKDSKIKTVRLVLFDNATIKPFLEIWG